jgi:predicted transcriptional regulator
VDKEIARELGLSVRTVRAHMNIAMRRLHARTRAEAVVTAVRNGWLPELELESTHVSETPHERELDASSPRVARG